MAIDLKAVFSVQDKGTSKLRSILKQTQSLDKGVKAVSKSEGLWRDSNGKLRNSLGQFAKSTNSAKAAVGGLRNGMNGIRGTVSSVRSSMSGLVGTVGGVAGAYLTAQSAVKAFNATIGAAANRQQNLFALEGMFGDASKAKEYVNMLNKMAIQSPVLNTTDMQENSKAFVGLSKDMNQLQKMWNVVERVQAFAGVDTQQAAFSTKELLQGDYLSIVNSIGLDKREMQRIAKLGSVDQKISALDKVLDEMGVNDAMIERMGNSTKGQWSSINEKIESFLATISSDGNNRLAQALGSVNNTIDGLLNDKAVEKLSDIMGNIVDKSIEIGKWLWKWKEPIAYIAGSLAVMFSAFAIIGTLSLLTGPIGIISAAIAGISIAFVALKNNSQVFNDMLDGIKTKASGIVDTLKDVFGGFKLAFGLGGTTEQYRAAGDTGYTMLGGDGGIPSDAVVGFADMFRDTFGKVTEIFDNIKNKVLEVKDIFVLFGENVVLQFSTLWAVAGPILSAFWSLLKVVGEFIWIIFKNLIAPAIEFVLSLVQLLWTISAPIFLVLAELVNLLATAFLWFWDNVLAPFVDFISSGVKGAFDLFSSLLQSATDWLGGLGDKVNTVLGYIKDFANYIKGVKLPDWLSGSLGKIGGVIKNVVSGGGMLRGYYHGSDYIPTDRIAKLHKGERVLTAQENKEYSQGGKGGIVINISGTTIHEKADMDEFVNALAKRIQREAVGLGYL